MILAVGACVGLPSSPRSLVSLSVNHNNYSFCPIAKQKGIVYSLIICMNEYSLRQAMEKSFPIDTKMKYHAKY